MGAGVLVFSLIALALLLPHLVQMYLERLPVAPACPACRSVTRQRNRWPILQRVVSLAATSWCECSGCGWTGRMRWKWASNPLRHGRD